MNALLWVCLLTYVVGLAQGSTAPADLLGLARGAARADEHARAIELYRQAFAADPSLHDEAGSELGAQLTWAGRYDEAIATFREFLERHPDHLDAWKTMALAQAWSGRTEDALASYRAVLAREPSDRGARLGEARMLSWLGQSGPALARYGALVADEPDFVDAQLAMAELHNWRGDHRRAWRMYEEILRAHPSPAAWEGLVQARRWAGRSDLAVAALDSLEAAFGETAGSRSLRNALAAEWSPRIHTWFDHSQDSDDFEATVQRIESESPFRYRGHARLGLTRNIFRRSGWSDQSDMWISAAGDWRLATPWLVTGALRVPFVRPSGADEMPIEADLGAGYLPDDRWRFDAVASRFSLFTFEVLPERITAELIGAGVSWRFHHRASVVVAGDRAWYSDDNDRLNFRGRILWQALSRPVRLRTEAGVHLLDYDRWTGNGYWAPSDYRAYSGRLDATYDPWQPVTLKAGLDGGWAKEAEADLDPYLSYYGGVLARVDGASVEFTVGYSDANVETGRGYSRTYGSLGVTVGF